MTNDNQKLAEKLNEITDEICAMIIKPDLHPWDSLTALMQSTIVVSAASGIPLESILEHANMVLKNPIAIDERNRLELAYKKEYAKTKNHLGIAPK